ECFADNKSDWPPSRAMLPAKAGLRSWRRGMDVCRDTRAHQSRANFRQKFLGPKVRHSYDDFQSVARDLDSGLLHLCAFARAGHKNRVCVVYVGVNLPARRRLMQEIEAAVTDRQVVHLARTAGAWPNRGQFAIAPERAIEQNDIGFVNCIPQFIG